MPRVIIKTDALLFLILLAVPDTGRAASVTLPLAIDYPLLRFLRSDIITSLKKIK
jgi:hypothetical protein